ncbi:MAG: LEA type 2 family protein [Myxococcales bacterium]|nr:LEA type 2 family protein [Myxococcales bacterium]
MPPSSRRSLLLLPLVLGLASMGCTIHVETPRLTARDMHFVGFDNNGVVFDVSFMAYNNNGFDLDLRDMNANLWIEGNHVGSSVTTLAAHLPVRREVPVQARVTVPWQGAPAYLMAGLGQPVVNYQLRGEVTVQHYLSVRASFETAGQVPREFFLRGAQNGLNNVLQSVLPGMGVQMP